MVMADDADDAVACDASDASDDDLFVSLDGDGRIAGSCNAALDFSFAVWYTRAPPACMSMSAHDEPFRPHFLPIDLDELRGGTPTAD